jgi:hypothetical protein
MSILESFISMFWDIAPIIGVILIFQLFIIKEKIPDMSQTLFGIFMVWIGLTLFIVGLDKALFPIGKIMATQLTSPDFLGKSQLGWNDYYWVYLFSACIGFSTAIAEPSLLAVSIKANEVSGNSIRVWPLRITVALGVAIGIALGSYRIVAGLPLHYFIIAGYAIVIVQTYFAPKQIIALAYDTGGVTTSTVTVPLVAALGLGLASTIEGRNPLIDGFGLIAFANLFPIMVVLAYAQLKHLINK